MARSIYTAPAIHCEGCANAIKRSLGKLPGVESVEVDVPAKRITVHYDGSSQEEAAIRERLERAGYPVQPLDS